MFEQLKELIEADEDEEIFYIGSVAPEKVKQIEQALGLGNPLPEDYREFLETYNMLIGYGVEIMGCGNAEPQIVTETKRYRGFGLPENFVVIRDVGEWIYCLNVDDGTVISWDRINKNPKRVADSFEQYLTDELLEAKEDWD